MKEIKFFSGVVCMIPLNGYFLVSYFPDHKQYLTYHESKKILKESCLEVNGNNFLIPPGILKDSLECDFSFFELGKNQAKEEGADRCLLFFKAQIIP